MNTIKIVDVDFRFPCACVNVHVRACTCQHPVPVTVHPRTYVRVHAQYKHTPNNAHLKKEGSSRELEQVQS